MATRWQDKAMAKRHYLSSGCFFVCLLALVLVLPCQTEAASIPAQPEGHAYGDIPEWAWQLDTVPFDPSAAAVILQDVGYVRLDYGQAMSFRRHVRIKILRPEAVSLADVFIPVYHEDNLEQLTSLKAASYNRTAQGQIKVNKLKRKQSYLINRDAQWQEQVFSLPAVRAGTIIEYRYTILSENIAFLESWDFQQDYPVIYSQINVQIPDQLQYRVLLQGKQLAARYDAQPRNSWELDALPAIPQEPYAPNPDNYVERIRFQLQNYRSSEPGVVGTKVWLSLMRDWEELASQLEGSNPWLGYTSRTSLYHKLAAGLSSIEASQLAISKRLLGLMHERFTWSGAYSIFPQQSLKESLRSRRCNSFEQNMIYCALLRQQGLEAWPVITSTRDNGRLVKELPLLSQCNHVLVQYVADGDTLLSDATAPWLAPGELPLQTANEWGYRISSQYPGWVSLPAEAHSRVEWLVQVQFDSLLVPTHYIQRWQKNHGLRGSDPAISALQPEELKALHQLQRQGFDIEDVQLLPLDSTRGRGISFILRLDATSVHKSVILPGLSIVSPIRSQPFSAADRLLPIDFGSSRHLKIRQEITLPRGYGMPDAGQNKEIGLPLAYGSYTYAQHQEAGLWVVEADLKLERKIPTRFYNSLRQFYTQFLQLQDQAILLQAN